MRAIVFINGEVRDYEAIRLLVRDDDLLIAADGGVRHILAIGRAPNLLVGDLDSVDAATVESLRASGVVVEQHPRAKDETDLELAIVRALREGAGEVILVGVAGGRLDQTLANILILAQREWPVPLWLVEGGQRATLLRGPCRMSLFGRPGDTVSAIPLSATVTGITYTGLAYPLVDAALSLGSTRGISNELAGTTAEVAIESGLLLVVADLAHDERPDTEEKERHREPQSNS